MVSAPLLPPTLAGNVTIAVAGIISASHEQSRQTAPTALGWASLNAPACVDGARRLQVGRADGARR
jgi:hypothetical protein